MSWYYDEPGGDWDGPLGADSGAEEDEGGPEWYEADAYMPLDLIELWADAPEIPAPVFIATKIYVLGEGEAA